MSSTKRVISTLCIYKRVISTFSTKEYGVATMSRMLKNIGLFCKRDLQKRPIFCKETYIFKHPTHRSHPIISTLSPKAYFLQTCRISLQKATCFLDMCLCSCVSVQCVYECEALQVDVHAERQSLFFIFTRMRVYIYRYTYECKLEGNRHTE